MRSERIIDRDAWFQSGATEKKKEKKSGEERLKGRVSSAIGMGLELCMVCVHADRALRQMSPAKEREKKKKKPIACKGLGALWFLLAVPFLGVT